MKTHISRGRGVITDKWTVVTTHIHYGEKLVQVYVVSATYTGRKLADRLRRAQQHNESILESRMARSRQRRGITPARLDIRRKT